MDGQQTGEIETWKVYHPRSTIRVHYYWTEKECDIVRALFPDYERIKKKLPHRSMHAIRKQCVNLGLKFPLHRYSAPELAKLRKMYAAASKEEILAAFPHSDWTRIRGVAHYYGFKRHRRKYKPTGDPAMDAFLSKVYEVGLYLPAIDNRYRKVGYFERQNWRRDGVNYKKLGTALRQLGGQFEVKWLDFDE